MCKELLAVSEPNYKRVVSASCDDKFKDLNSFTQEDWKIIIEENTKKANYIVNDEYSYPCEHIEQIEIFESQKEKYIGIQNKVAVLSAFPIFLADYYGYEKLREIIND